MKGYRLVIAMPESMSAERMQMMRAFGAELLLTPAAESVEGAVRAAERFASEHPETFMPRQFENEVNPLAHERTTAREILDAVKGRIDAVVAGVGTGGTLAGVARGLRAGNPGIITAAVYPHAEEKEHKIQGIGDGFMPTIMEGARVDREIRVRSSDAILMMRKLARLEGLLAGISSGANVWASVKLAEELGPGKRIVTFAPDNGERYLSMGLF